MARPLRIEFPGALYYITAKGNENKAIFMDNQDKESFLNVLSLVTKRFDWQCHAYVLMSNHYHLLVETPKANLSRGMMQLNGIYTQKLNRRHHRVGHLFQGRYKSIVVEKELYLLDLNQYMVLNPVRSGLANQPEEWPWSSYAATIANTPKPDFLTTDWILAQFGKNKSKALEAYKQFVMAGYGMDFPAEGFVGQAILGTVRFLKEINDYLSEEKVKMSKEIPREQRYSSRTELDEIFQKEMTVGKHRNEIICIAYNNYDYTMREIGDYLGLHYATVSRAVKECEKKQHTLPKTRKHI